MCIKNTFYDSMWSNCNIPESSHMIMMWHEGFSDRKKLSFVNSVCQTRLEFVQTIQMLERGFAWTTHKDQLSESFVACQSRRQGEACHRKALLAEVKTRSRYAPPPHTRLRGRTSCSDDKCEQTGFKNTSRPWFVKWGFKNVYMYNTSRNVMLNCF